ncbi:MAG: HAD hydrolase-like protein [Roseiarcus sp.]|jgi:phosphoglycolate phosphatase|uniref:HAD hydrolase-like protein n=1 Tax=Roseiarcus sp. TaxID=1969460 RepID=UPI003C276E3F
MTEAAAVLFDLDGTLTDSAAGIQRSTREALRRLNAEDGGARPIPAESELGWIVGPPLRESFAKLAGDENADRMLEFYRERYDTIGIFENKVYDGVAAALDHLRARGDRLFVATSKRRADAQRVVAHFGLDHYFDGVYGANSDGRGAEKSTVLTAAIAGARLEAAQRIVMIGDRRYDALGARAVGIPAIGALWGYGDRAELTEAGADPIIASPREIPNAVDAVFARAV